MEVMFSRHSAAVVDAMWAVCCLPTVQRVASQIEVVFDSVLNFVRSLIQSFNNLYLLP